MMPSPKTLLALMALFLLPVMTASAQNAPASPPSPYYAVRNGLPNSPLHFQQSKQGRVAYIGGSITASSGWRDLTYDLLKKRFPETSFDFINAGIGGTNSSFGAFRFEDDVFKQGPVDLLFLEFAVNDAGGSSPGNRPARAMEGIIRHAKALNPAVDILILYFVDKEKTVDFSAGKIPDIIQEHEKVAAYYGIPAINLAQEMTRRLNNHEFTWDEFSRDSCHPQPLGHQQYAGCIEAFLDEAWKSPTTPSQAPMPEPMDPNNYEKGRFISVDAATVVNGWTRVPAWNAEKTCNYSGPVDVLAAEQPGATLELKFQGSLIGISAIAGMDAGILKYSIDNAAPVSLDLFDNYCLSFHRPVCHVLAEDLSTGEHVLHLIMDETANSQSTGHAARILKFVAN